LIWIVFLLCFEHCLHDCCFVMFRDFCDFVLFSYPFFNRTLLYSILTYIIGITMFIYGLLGYSMGYLLGDFCNSCVNALLRNKLFGTLL